MSNVNYELVEHPNGFHDEHWCVKVGEGDYKDIIYQYDTIHFNESNPEGTDAVLKFNTITIENPNDMDLTTEEFSDIIGGILVDIIGERLKDVDESDKDNYRKLDPQ